MQAPRGQPAKDGDHLIARDIITWAPGGREEFDSEEESQKSTIAPMRSRSQKGFCLQKGEPVPTGMRRIVQEQIDKAIRHLTSRAEEPDEAIHKARICFKKIRAALQLIRSDLGDETFTTENHCYRDAARRLSAVRDTAAMVEAVEQLGRRFPEQLPAESVAELRGPFIQAERKVQAEKEKTMEEVAGVIVAARARVDRWQIGNGFVTIKKGLRVTYRKGRSAYKLARRMPTTTNLHEWRKLVKYLWYQVTVLNEASPKVAKVAKKIKRLTDDLSDAHDLAMLSQTLRRRRHAHQPIALHIKRGLAVAAHRRQNVREKSLALGARIYARKPRRWVNRATRRWNLEQALE